jgi:succinyl-CoA synthetase beta subunit
MSDTRTTTFSDRLISSLETLMEDQDIQVILINFLGNIPQVNQLSEIIANFLLQLDSSKTASQSSATNGNHNQQDAHLPKLVLRLAGSEFNHTREYLANLSTSNQSPIVVENLDEAVKQAVRLAKLPVVKKRKRQ